MDASTLGTVAANFPVAPTDAAKRGPRHANLCLKLERSEECCTVQLFSVVLRVVMDLVVLSGVFRSVARERGRENPGAGLLQGGVRCETSTGERGR